jgi:hypothetical protein
MSKKTLLFLSGIADDQMLKVKSIDPKGEMHFKFDGNYLLANYLPDTHFNKIHVLLDTHAEQQITMPEFDAVFNQIANANTHTVTLSKVKHFYDSQEGKLPFINTPACVEATRKDNLDISLANIQNLHIPKSVLCHPRTPDALLKSIEAETIQYPVIVQSAEDDSILPILLMKQSTSLNSLALNGQGYIVSEFISYQLNEYYRKERLVVVDGEVFLANVQFSDNPYITESTQVLDEETNIMRASIAKRFDAEIKPLIQTTITDIHQLLGLDFFILDCHIDMHKQIHLFRVNPDVDIFAVQKNDLFSEQLNAIHAKIISMIAGKL